MNPLESARRKAFDAAIQQKLGDSMMIPDKREPDEYAPYEDDDIGTYPQDVPETDENQYDLLINSEVQLPHMNRQTRAVVIGQHRDDNGDFVGRVDDNPILSRAIYDVTFPDGTVKQYAANTIAENMFAQVDEDGHTYLVLDAITGHRSNEDAVKIENQYMIMKDGCRKLRQTTKGWDLCVQWRTGNEQWIPLRVLKE